MKAFFLIIRIMFKVLSKYFVLDLKIVILQSLDLAKLFLKWYVNFKKNKIIIKNICIFYYYPAIIIM